MHLEDLTFSFIDSAKEWLNTYLEVYPTNDATPYMHILVYHVAESIMLNGNLCHFTQQGLEKLNDDIMEQSKRQNSNGHAKIAERKDILIKHVQNLRLLITSTTDFKSE